MKKVCWFLIIVLLLGCFAGCQQARGPIENADGTLSDWMKREIESYGRTISWDICWYEENSWSGVRYYGTENGYVFLFNHGISSMAKTRVIGEYSFYCPMDFHLLAYKDNALYNVEDLYKDGILSDECIKKIYSAHCAYEMAT